jgi:hypothetical protein
MSMSLTSPPVQTGAQVSLRGHCAHTTPVSRFPDDYAIVKDPGTPNTHAPWRMDMPTPMMNMT